MIGSSLRRPAALVIALAVLLLLLPVPSAHAQTPECPDCPVTFENPTILSPSSSQAAEIRQLFVVILVLAAAVFVIVEALLVLSVLRFRNRPPEMAIQTHGNTRLEIAWTAAPALILVVLLGFTLQTMAASRAPGHGDPLTVQVIGHQWWWEFRYPDLGIVTANQMVVPEGREVRLNLESVDVIHSFWIPELHGKQDAIPGRVTYLAFVPQRSGQYGGQCAEFCGDQHANMRMAVVVKSPADFEAWVQAQKQPPPPPSGDAAAGQQAFLTGACVACHTVEGTAAQGKIGPDLTHVASRDFIAGGILANTPENLAKWIKNPQAWKPGTQMPNLRLDDAAVNDLVAYLASLK